MSTTATPPPPLNIPLSTSTVNVSIIDTTSRITIPTTHLVEPAYAGFPSLHCPAFSFLIEHASSHRKFLFDLGVRKDWENGPEVIVRRIKEGGWGVTVEKGVAEILREGGVDPEDVEGIIWSHHHWDHTGDPSTFPPTTDLIVGPGFKDAFIPGFPTNPNSSIAESAYKGRTLREISFQNSRLKLGRCRAIDFFDDGSFYLLDTPGHAIGHMCALCRTSADPDSFMFLGGDCAHHGGEIRPTPYLPLPQFFDPSPIPRVHAGVCPGSLFASIHRLHPSEKASMEPLLLPRPGAAVDVEAARESIRKLGEFDGCEDVFTVLAHDDSVLDVVGKFPEEKANRWMKKGWKEKTLWRFLEDFGPAVEERKTRGKFGEISERGSV